MSEDQKCYCCGGIIIRSGQDKDYKLEQCYYCRMREDEDISEESVKPLTSKEARKITDSNSQTLIENILKEIKKTAEGGKYSMHMNRLGISKSGQNEIINVLTELGYDVYNVRKAYDDDVYFEFTW